MSERPLFPPSGAPAPRARRPIATRVTALAALAAFAALAALLALAGPASAAVEFANATRASGVDFRHTGGGYDPWFPEMMGSGACWLDADQDGLEDLFLLNGAHRNQALQAAERPTGKFYLNVGGGAFRDATAGSGLAFEGFSNACSVADWNADGCLDVYVSGYDLSKLFRNRCDATFEDVTAASGVANDDCPEFPCFAHSSAWADIDLDGDLDLYIANYVKLNQSEIQYNAPGPYEGQFNALYRNNGDGTFTDVAHEVGLAGHDTLYDGKSLGVAWQDYDKDGDPDVYVANDETPAYLFQNDGTGHFTDIAPARGVNYTRAGMGVAWGDWDANGCSDLMATHFSGEYDGFVRNYCGGDVRDESGTQHGIFANNNDVRWGLGFVDYDNDAYRDIFVVSGGVYYTNQTTMVFPSQNQPTVYHNELANPGRAYTFSNASGLLGDVSRARINARGAAFADFDLDGGIDVAIVANNNGSAQLFRAVNQTGHFFEIALRDPSATNGFAVGAKVQVTAAGRTQYVEHFPGYSFESSNSYTLHFGLGAATTVSELRVTWPDGGVSTFADVPADHVYRLTRGVGLVNDTVAPVVTLRLEGARSPDGRWLVSGAGFTLEATDRGARHISGVARILYTVDGGPETLYEGFVPLADGEHTIRAWAVDAAGNRARDVVATARVDTVAPVTVAALSEAPAASGWHLARPTLTLTATDATSGVARIEWRPALGTHRAYGGPMVLADGEHAVAYRAVDAAGNAGAERVVEARVDATLPEVALEIDGVPGLDGWWRSPVTVNVAASDATSGVARREWQRGGAAPEPFATPITLGEGRVYVLGTAYDAAGHRNDTPAEEVKVDATPPATTPTFAIAGGNAGWTRGVVADLTATDALSGVAAVLASVAGAPEAPVAGPLALPDGNVALAWRARDVAGNYEATASRAFRIDSAAPTTTVSLAGVPGENGWWRSAVEATVAATDATSGVAATRVAIGDAPLALHDGRALTFAAEGATRLAVASEDVAGNAEDVAETVVRVDTVAPTAELVVDGAALRAGWIGRATARAVVSDAASGVAEAALTSDGAPISDGWNLPEGEHVLALRARDVAGNAAPVATRAVRVDETPPVTTLRVDGASYDGGDTFYVAPGARLLLDAADAASGVAETWVSVDGAPASPYAGPIELAGKGDHTLAYWSVDVAGRAETARTRIVRVDGEAPELALDSPAPDAVAAGRAPPTALPLGGTNRTLVVSGEVRVVARAADAGAGVARVVVLVDGVARAEFRGGDADWTWRAGAADAGEHVVTVLAIDHVGNVAVRSARVVVLPVPVEGAPDAGALLP